MGAANAPVAFARTDDLKPLFNAWKSSSPDGMMVHAVEMVTALTWAQTAGTFGAPIFIALGPQSTNLHPWLSAMAPLFQRYKLKFLRLHYQHFCGTAIAGQVILQYFPDTNFNNGVTTGLTQAIVSECGNFMTGAAYEDFCHTADLSAVDKTQWFDCQVTPPTDEANLNYCGIVAAYTMNQAVTQAPTGNIWLEAVYEFSGRSMAAITVGLADLKEVILSRKLNEEQKRYYSAAVVTKMIQDESDRQKAKAESKLIDPNAKLKAKYGIGAKPDTGTNAGIQNSAFFPRGQPPG